MKKTTRILALALALVLAFALCACGGKAPAEQQQSETSSNPTVPTNPPAIEATEAPKSAATSDATVLNPDAVYGGTFTNNRSTSPSGGLFSIYRFTGDVYIAPCVQTLVRLDPLTNEIVPLLAKSVDFDVDKNQVTVKLQEGVKFHDGSEMTAEVVKWNIDFMCENGQAGNLDNPSKVEAVDNNTLVISYDTFHLDAPNTMSQVYVYSKQTYDEKGLDYCLTHPVGTGAFVFDEYIPDNMIKYVRNDNYWQEGLPYLDGWNCLIMNDATTLEAAFANGEVSCFNHGNPMVAKDMMAMGYNLKTADCHSTRAFWGVMVNNKVEGDPWSDLKVRQAVLLYGIDYKAMARTMGFPEEWATKQFNGVSALCYDEGVDYDQDTFDLEKAKAMLAEAGYANGFSTKIYTVITYVTAATIWQAQLKELGIDAEIVTLNSSDPIFYDGTTPGMYMMMFIGKYDFISGTIGRYFMGPNSYGNHVALSDEFKETLAKADAAKTWEERAELGKKLQKMMVVDECFCVNAFYNTAFHFIQDYAHDSGFEYNTYIPELTWVEQ